MLGWLVYRSERHDDDLDSVALTIFVAFFLLVTVMGFVAAKWRDPNRHHCGGRRQACIHAPTQREGNHV